MAEDRLAAAQEQAQVAQDLAEELRETVEDKEAAILRLQKIAHTRQVGRLSALVRHVIDSKAVRGRQAVACDLSHAAGTASCHVPADMRLTVHALLDNKAALQVQRDELMEEAVKLREALDLGQARAAVEGATSRAGKLSAEPLWSVSMMCMSYRHA